MRTVNRGSELRRVRPSPLRVVGALGLFVAALAVMVAPAGAATSMPTNLRWVSPHSIQVGTAREFRSVDPCPATHPDGSPITGTPKVQLTVLFPKGGGVGEVFPLAADGSWTATWAPNIGSSVVLPHGRSTIQAECLDVTGTGVVVAQYRVHTIRIST